MKTPKKTVKTEFFEIDLLEPEDILWVLLAVSELETIRPGQLDKNAVGVVRRLAGDWINSSMHYGDDHDVPVELAGLAAWVMVNGGIDYNDASLQWALQQLRIEFSSRPDELVSGLIAWKKNLEQSRKQDERANSLDER